MLTLECSTCVLQVIEYMRAVMRTLAQCHAAGILHRGTCQRLSRNACTMGSQYVVHKQTDSLLLNTMQSPRCTLAYNCAIVSMWKAI